MAFPCPSTPTNVGSMLLLFHRLFGYCFVLRSTAARSKRKSDEGGTAETQPAKKPRKTKAKPYVPTLRSGPYAIILALSTLEENASQGMTKSQLIETAQPHCESSFTAPSDSSKFHTAWASMKTLLQKELVYDHGRPLKRYALTEEGWEVAKRIKAAAPSDPSQRTLSFRAESVSFSSISEPAVLHYLTRFPG